MGKALARIGKNNKKKNVHKVLGGNQKKRDH
jgi:hypothetical protein